MNFRTLKDCRDFFNLMMIEHDVKGILEYASLELWDVKITDEQLNPLNWESVKVLTGKNGEIFIFSANIEGRYSLVHDIAVEDDSCSELPEEVVAMLEKAVAHDYVPVGLLIAISDFRADPEEIDTADNFLMTYGTEVDAALKMINLLYP